MACQRETRLVKRSIAWLCGCEQRCGDQGASANKKISYALQEFVCSNRDRWHGGLRDARVSAQARDVVGMRTGLGGHRYCKKVSCSTRRFQRDVRAVAVRPPSPLGEALLFAASARGAVRRCKPCGRRWMETAAPKVQPCLCGVNRSCNRSERADYRAPNS